MLDYNHTPKFADVLNAVVDAALTAENAARPRATISAARGSAIRASAPCSSSLPARPRTRAPASPARRSASSPSATPSKRLAIGWLRAAGIDLYVRKGHRPDGEQFGFSVAGGRIRGHVDGIIASASANS